MSVFLKIIFFILVAYRLILLFGSHRDFLSTTTVKTPEDGVLISENQLWIQLKSAGGTIQIAKVKKFMTVQFTDNSGQTSAGMSMSCKPDSFLSKFTSQRDLICPSGNSQDTKSVEIVACQQDCETNSDLIFKFWSNL